jgi:hypothetical protein
VADHQPGHRDRQHAGDVQVLADQVGGERRGQGYPVDQQRIPDHGSQQPYDDGHGDAAEQAARRGQQEAQDGAPEREAAAGGRGDRHGQRGQVGGG